jgi:hypothetical protein
VGLVEVFKSEYASTTFLDGTKTIKNKIEKSQILERQ